MRAEYIKDSPGRIAIVPTLAEYDVIVATHPKQWAYCMRPIDAGGLGLRKVLDYMGIPTGCEQSNLNDFTEEDEDRCTHIGHIPP